MRITTLANPRQVILVTCRFSLVDNIIALCWHTPLSSEPIMYAISVAKAHYSYELIKKAKVFVVNFMSQKYKQEVYYCGSHSGQDGDKFKATGLKKIEAETIDCPKIKQALGWLECQVKKTVPAGDHVLFIAEVSKAELKQVDKRLFQLHHDQFTTTID